MWIHLVICSLLLCISENSAASKKPHIIFILCDDVGWNDVSYHGSDQIPTPNIDALAYSGFILHNHYVQPICTPSRASLMTGRYPSKIGMQGVPIGGAQPRALPDGKILPQYLKDLGYVTRHIGKWHLGFYEVKYTPIKRGFDSSIGYYNGLTSYFTHVYDDPLPKWKDICKNGRQGRTIDFSKNHLYGMDMNRNNTPAWDLSGRYATDLFTEEAVKQIHEHNPSSPLFMYVAHLACHAGNWGENLEAPQETINKFPHIIDPNRRTYAAMMSKLDDSVGEIMAALKAKKMLENSIVIFMSDNGGPTVLDSKWQTPASNYPLRGTKVTQWEGGIRVPAILWSPLLKHNVHVSNHLMHISDWLPTLYSAAGGNPDDLKNVPMDGVDQWNALVHNKDSARDEILQVYDMTLNHTALRKGAWKLSQGFSQMGDWDGYYGDTGVSSKNPKYDVQKIYNSDAGSAISSVKKLPKQDAILKLRNEVTLKCPPQENPTPCDTFQDMKPCLFNIAKDPCETNDLSSQHPDTFKQLLDLLNKHHETAVPVTPVPYEPNKANPAKFNDTWIPWNEKEVCYKDNKYNC
ncbi:Arylsulfatase B [Blattella germanica]|nr:Arylsulfatase B [Blattella germanica]